MSAPATVSSRKVYRGDPYSMTLNFVDDAGAPIDLSGSTFFASLDDPTIDWTVLTTELADGIVTLSLTAEQTAAIVTTPARWDFAETPIWTQTLLLGELLLIRRVKPDVVV